MSILNSLTGEAGKPAAPPAGADLMASFPARPRKVAPQHPGEVAADILDEQDVSMRAAAKAIGLSPNGLNKVLLGQGPVTAETALRFGVYFGNGPDIWLRLQNAYDLWHAKAEIGKDVAKIKPLKVDKR